MKLKPIIIVQVDTQSELKYMQTDFSVRVHF